jgi:hypothetical protein
MNVARTALVAAALGLGLAACSTPAATTIIMSQSPSAHVTHSSAAPAPTVTKTEVQTAPASTAAPVPVPTPSAAPNVTDPWAVVSAYYGDIESGDYAEAWALLDSGMTTGQTYQQFVNGFACTGAQDLSKNWESGDEVNFDLAATNDCTGAIQTFTGTDTVVGGKIVAADVSQTG